MPELPHVPAPPLPVTSYGVWSFRAVEPDRPERPSADVDLVHRWMHQPHVERWWHEAWPRDRWALEIGAFRSTHALHSLPLFACADGPPGPGPIAYLQVYRVARDRIRDSYRYDDHDLGLHIAIGRDEHIDRRHGRAMLRAVCAGLLAADPRCRRVVAEPDVHNVMSIRAFAAAGFGSAGLVTLPDKTADLLVFGRTDADREVELAALPVAS